MKRPQYFAESERRAAEQTGVFASVDLDPNAEPFDALSAGELAELVADAARSKPNAILVSAEKYAWMRERTPLSLRMLTERWSPSTPQERLQLDEEQRRLFVRMGLAKPPTHTASDF